MGRNTSNSRLQWRNRAAVTAIRTLGALPPRTNHLLGQLAGRLLARLPGENRHVTRVNLDLCFPDQPVSYRERLEKLSLIEAGRATLEAAFIWRQPQKALDSIRRVDGGELLEAAVAAGQPVIILAPHLGCWELLNYWLSTHYDLHVLYSPSGLEAVDKLIADSRETFASSVHPATPRGVVGLVRALKKGKMTAILPDQVPERSNTHFAPFYGQPAATASLACRLIKQTNATAFCCFAKRLPGNCGYDIIVRAADDAIYADALDTSLAAMNRSIETLIDEAPAQYLWSYKRFRRRPDGRPNPYKSPLAS